MKKKVIFIALALVLVGGIIASAILIPKLEYAKDSNDTEELYRQNVASVNYENSVETAYPQTDLYSIIEKHFK